jgi:aspartyl-tRNA synthetase
MRIVMTTDEGEVIDVIEGDEIGSLDLRIAREEIIQRIVTALAYDNAQSEEA